MNGLLIALDRRYPAAAKRIACAHCGAMFPEAWQEFLNDEGRRICEAACKPSALCGCTCHSGDPIGSHVVACCAAPAIGVLGTSITLSEWFGMTQEDQDRAAEQARGVERKYPPTLAEFAEMIEAAVTPRQKVKGKKVPTRPARRAKTVSDVSQIEDPAGVDYAAVQEAAAQPDPPLDPRVEEREQKFRRMVKLMGNLLVARKDVYAIETLPNGTWMPARADMFDTDSQLLPMGLKDFRMHFFEDRCMGTYLLDANNMVKFLAFDVDLKKSDAPYFPVRDAEEMEAFLSEHNGEDQISVVNGVLELEMEIGNLEAALHDPSHTGYRWARIRLDGTMKHIAHEARETLGLPTLCVVTGGGGHVLVPFGALTPASEARSAARAVMEACGYTLLRGDNFWTPGGDQPVIEIETFPKQDTLPNSGGFGNLIRLPLGMHFHTKKRTYFTHQGPFDLPNTSAWDLPRVDALTTMEDAAASLNLKV